MASVALDALQQLLAAVQTNDPAAQQAAAQALEAPTYEHPDRLFLQAIVSHLQGDTPRRHALLQQLTNENIQRSDLMRRLAHSLALGRHHELARNVMLRAISIDDGNLFAKLDLHDALVHRDGFLSDVVEFREPPATGTPLFRMYRCFGADQIVTESLGPQGWRGYEAPLPAILVATVRAFPGVFVDVGANTGFFALLVAATTQATVLAFEPQNDVARLLLKNVLLNALERRITIARAAVGDVDGPVTIVVPQNMLQHVETSAAITPRPDRLVRFRYEAVGVTLDRWFAEQPTEQPVSVVKIDVEGHEPQVLLGAVETLRRDRPLVFLEVMDETPVARLNRLLAEHAYASVVLYADRAQVRDSMVYDEDQRNQVLVPREKLTPFLNVLASAGGGVAEVRSPS